MKDILLITPPFTQLNTPYPATAYLKGFLNTKGITSFQMDLGLEVILALFSSETFSSLFDFALENDTIHSENAQRIYTLKDEYLRHLDEIILFLQGKNSNFARQICTPDFLPQASRFDQVEELDWAFGTMGMQDKAKHLATLFIEDLSDFIIECVDDNFGFSRYAEHLGMSANSFDGLYQSLQEEASPIDHLSLEIFDNAIKALQAKLVCFSVPFPGNLYSAFRCAQYVKTHYPDMKIVMGGGFPNTELRSLKDKRVFEFFDYITLDDGELPLELIHKVVLNNASKAELKRTYCIEDKVLTYNDRSTIADYKQHELGTPDYSDLYLEDYISIIEIANPMHSLWSDGRWNKLTMAHGCYWAKCTFCELSLPYIGHYEANTAQLLVDRMEAIIAQTGERGFHFVDEAAPPHLMKALALEILKRELSVTWWTNVRFEKSFTKDFCFLLKASGCIAVAGGLEVASDRLLKLINKGVTVSQVAEVTRNFTEANILVHAYLMYGFPSQTEQETVDSLEMVRQLFEMGIVQSAFWHQFALTAHSPVGLNPEKYKITPQYKEIQFANNDVDFVDETGITHQKYSDGLKVSLFNYMQGLGFDLKLQDWFGFPIPKTTIDPDFIYNSLQLPQNFKVNNKAQVLYLGHLPLVEEVVKKKKGRHFESLLFTFHDKTDSFEVSLEKTQGEWLLEHLEQLMPWQESPCTFEKLKQDFESQFDNFELFWFSKAMEKLRARQLLVL